MVKNLIANGIMSSEDTKLAERTLTLLRIVLCIQVIHLTLLTMQLVIGWLPASEQGVKCQQSQESQLSLEACSFESDCSFFVPGLFQVFPGD